VNCSKNNNTDNILDAIHDRSSLQQAQITELIEAMFSVSTVRMNGRLDHWSVAPLISSWLIITQQLVRSCFRWRSF